MHFILLLSILAVTVSFSITAPAATHTVQTFTSEKTRRLTVKLKPGVAGMLSELNVDASRR